MPRVQIPLVSDIGFYSMGDLPPTDIVGSYAGFLNGYFEKSEMSPLDQDTRRVAYIKRPGVNYVLTSGFTAGHKIQGLWTSIDRFKAFIYTNNGATNTTWYWDALSGTLTNRGTAPAATGSWTNAGAVVATILDGISYGGNNFYAVTDFSKGALVDSTGTWTEITNAVFTGLSKVTNFVALDGYLFIGTNTNRIYNCDLNTPTSWSATSFLNATDTPGNLQWLIKVRNFLIAFKDKSIEFFEDLGNPTPGSPLEPRKQYNRNIGCINKSSIKEMSDGIIFAGASDNSAPKMYKLNKADLSIQEISNRYVEQCLANGYSSVYNVDIIASSSSMFGQSQAFSYAGKEFYIIALKDPNLLSGDNPASLAYDNSMGVWTAWQSSFNGGSGDIGFYPSQAQMLSTTVTGTRAIGTVFANNFYSPPKLMVMDSLANTSSASNAYTDGGNPYNFKWISAILDFGNRKRKFMDSFEVIYESYNAGLDTPFIHSYTMTLMVMDYNYQATPSYRVQKTLPIDTGGGIRCMCRQLGSFRRRAFQLSQSADMALRIWAIEVDINEGETDEGGS